MCMRRKSYGCPQNGLPRFTNRFKLRICCAHGYAKLLQTRCASSCTVAKTRMGTGQSHESCRCLHQTTNAFTNHESLPACAAASYASAPIRENSATSESCALVVRYAPGHIALSLLDNHRFCEVPFVAVRMRLGNFSPVAPLSIVSRRHLRREKRQSIRVPMWSTAEKEQRQPNLNVCSRLPHADQNETRLLKTLSATLAVHCGMFAWHFLVGTTHHSWNFWQKLESQLLDLGEHFKRATTDVLE